VIQRENPEDLQRIFGRVMKTCIPEKYLILREKHLKSV
jgi:hypothetical protein